MPRLSTDRSCWKLDPVTRDLVVPIQWLRGAEAVAQRIGIRLRSFRGEWFADASFGVPWVEGAGVEARDALLGQKFDVVRARAAVRDVILATPNVGEILQLDVSFEASTRTLVVRFRVRCEFEDTTEDTSLQTVEI